LNSSLTKLDPNLHEFCRFVYRNCIPTRSSKRWAKVGSGGQKRDGDLRYMKGVECYDLESFVLGTMSGLCNFKRLYVGRIKELGFALEAHLKSEISTLIQEEVKEVTIQPGIMFSQVHGLQSAHLDATVENCIRLLGQLFIAFMPLTSDGMFLQLWKKEEMVGRLVFIPFGSVLIVPIDTLHAGGMCSSSSTGNIRMHFYIYINSAKTIPSNKHTNAYQTHYHNHPDIGKDGKLGSLFIRGPSLASVQTPPSSNSNQ